MLRHLITVGANLESDVEYILANAPRLMNVAAATAISFALHMTGSRRGTLMADRGWKRPFDDSIPVPAGARLGIVGPKGPGAASGLGVALGRLLRPTLVEPVPICLELAVHVIGDPTRLEPALVLFDLYSGRMLDDATAVELGVFERHPPDELPYAVALGEVVRHSNLCVNGLWENNKMLDTLLDVEPLCSRQNCQPEPSA